MTSVDSDRHIALDANRTPSGFAALGVGVRAAHLPDGYGSFSGTSYATPIVTATLARLLPRPDMRAATTALGALAASSPRLDGADGLYLIESSVAVEVQ